MRYSFPTAQPEIVAEGDVEGIQGADPFWPLGDPDWGRGEPCSLGELLGNLSSLLGTFSQLLLMEEFRQDQPGARRDTCVNEPLQDVGRECRWGKRRATVKPKETNSDYESRGI